MNNKKSPSVKVDSETYSKIVKIAKSEERTFTAIIARAVRAYGK